MKILLINTNPVVSKLFALCASDLNMELEEVGGIGAAKERKIDMLFVDEALYDTKMCTFMETIQAQTKTLLSFSGDLLEGFDEVIKKPFLPTQILQALSNIETIEETQMQTFDTQILRQDDISQIKILLEMSQEEVASKDFLEQGETVKTLSDSVDEDSQRLEKVLEEIKKRHKKKAQDYTTGSMDIEAVISNIITTLKPKKIKKLLNGEQIKIQLKTEEEA